MDSKSKEKELLKKLQSLDKFALKCASSVLGRNVKMSAMAIMCLDNETIFIVDVNKLGISQELKSILQNNQIKKLMFDCRPAADCLKYQHYTELSGIIDLQLIQYIKDHPDRRVAELLPTFSKTIANNISFEASQELRQLEIKDLFQWDQRPISEDLIQYIGKAISLYPRLFRSFLGYVPDDILQISRLYAFRRTRFQNYDAKNPYWENNFMPYHVLGKPKGGPYRCCNCDICLHRSMYDPEQFNRRQQECLVCRAVTKDIENNDTCERPRNYDSWIASQETKAQKEFKKHSENRHRHSRQKMVSG